MPLPAQDFESCASASSATRARSALRWDQPLRVARPGEEPLGEVYALFQLTKPSLHVLQLAQSASQLVHLAQLALHLLYQMPQPASGCLPPGKSGFGPSPNQPLQRSSERGSDDDNPYPDGPSRYFDAEHASSPRPTSGKLTCGIAVAGLARSRVVLAQGRNSGYGMAMSPAGGSVTTAPVQRPSMLQLALGFVTNFFDPLGIELF